MASVMRLTNIAKQFLSSTIKQDTRILKRNHFKYASHMIPHPEKVHKGGQDAFFASDKLLAVADGVGGWAEQGVDPGLYSKELCRHIQSLYKKASSAYVKTPKDIIVDSHKLNQQIGSTTCCVVTIDDEQPLLKACYIGDSGYMIFRKENSNIKPVAISQEQTKAFNFPFQIGSEGDSPHTAWDFEYEVQNNDLIVLGTDGVFDNVDHKQIIGCLKPFWDVSDQIVDLSLVAEILAKYTYKLSLDPAYMSPFAQRAYEYKYLYRGGKSDDITVIVAQVKLENK